LRRGAVISELRDVGEPVARMIRRNDDEPVAREVLGEEVGLKADSTEAVRKKDQRPRSSLRRR
jgi:hypothetical protein